jgi:hypothetical protein
VTADDSDIAIDVHPADPDIEILYERHHAG